MILVRSLTLTRRVQVDIIVLRPWGLQALPAADAVSNLWHSGEESHERPPAVKETTRRKPGDRSWRLGSIQQFILYRGVAQLVARLLWAEIASAACGRCSEQSLAQRRGVARAASGREGDDTPQAGRPKLAPRQYSTILYYIGVLRSW